MPKLTVPELQERKRIKTEERATDKAKQQEEQEKAEAARLERERWLIAAMKVYSELLSVVDALYQESDKLFKKHATIPVTQRMMDRTNKAIRDTKELLKEEQDRYLDDVSEFVGAGDTPEVRDTLLALAETRAALKRFEARCEAEYAALVRSQRGTLEDQDMSDDIFNTFAAMDDARERLDRRRRQ